MSHYPAHGDTTLFVTISGPSGAGKSTLISGFLQAHPEFVRCISVTTRPPGETALASQIVLYPPSVPTSRIAFAPIDRASRFSSFPWFGVTFVSWVMIFI